jgi:Bacterial Ig domain/PA14 domain/Secretion system C-terminal sorting domain/HYR domain/Bacterial protein of unknown function (DUF839)
MSNFNTLFFSTMGVAKKIFRSIVPATIVLILAWTNGSMGQNLTQTGFTSVLTPQYMSSGDKTRLPVMFRATVTGLTASTTYRFYNQAAISSDLGGTNPGAGNPLLISAAGAYKYTTGPSLTTAANFETFTTDGSGNFTGWFGFVNTGNARFTAGNLIFPTIVIGNNTTGAVIARRALDVSVKVLGYGNSAGANYGSFLKETTSGATAKNLVAIYDNLNGTGSPLYISPVSSIGVTIADVISGFTTSAGGWNAIIPNTNANGVQRIEQRSVTTADIIGCAKDTNGVWPTGSVNTVNPISGTTALTISSTDAPLTSCLTCPIITVTANAGTIICPGGSTTIGVSATGGTAPYTGTGSFTVTAGTYNYTITDANGCTGSTSVTVAPGTDTSKPAIYLQGNKILPGVTGSSSTQSPYLIPNKPGIKFTSIVSVNDAPGGYRMVGIPDGLGAFDNGNGTFTVLMNHELTNTVGIPRAHGSKGAFVSKWIINKSDLSVVSAGDLMQQLFLFDTTTQTFNPGTIAFSRFCSADLPAPSAFYNSSTGLGTQERIFMDGEESGNEGKAVGHIVTGPNAGKSYELPYLGKFSWENSVASPFSGNKTVVAGMDDGTGGQVYIYVGNKTNTGTEIEKAGLHNGKLFGIKVSGLLTEISGGVPAPGTRFELFDQGFVQKKTGATINAESVAGGVTTFLRPEDGAWDPSHPNDFYFATTNAFNGPSRLWRLRFDDILNPELGGTIEAVLNGTEGQQMLDNITIDKLGNILLVEDVGNNAHIGKTWQYKIATDEFTPIAYHDSTRFLIGGANFLTQDEEASGILDVSEILGPGMYLVDVQAHFAPAANTTEVVEGGQLLAMYNPYAFGVSTAPDTVKSPNGCGATINLGTPSTADNCSISSVTNNAPSSFPLGITNVTWTVTDGSGNTTTANQTVIVTDTIPPTITAPAGLNLATNDGCSATGINLGTPIVSDNCLVDSVTNNAPASFPLGTTLVTWTVTDTSGNIASAVQTVTVSDTLKPVIYLQGNSILQGITGLSSTQSPYLIPKKPGIKFTSLMSVNDVVGGYRMVGIPDGLGAFDNGNGTFTLLMNHELTNTVGITRAHGSKGAFVSKWIINKSDLSVASVSDLMQQVYLWDTTAHVFIPGTIAFSRFCSADLPAVSAFYNSASGLGTTERIFMDGEESGNEGKAVGHIVTGPNAGKSYELPYLGKFSWENSVASPSSGNKTVVAGMDDGTGGQVYIYVGNKTNAGTEIEKAGLHNGKLFGVKVVGLPLEINGSVPAAGTRFELFDQGFVQNKTGATLNTESVAGGVTTFMRPEDGAWDPSHPNDFYFATTNAFNGPSRLWRLRFDNILAPETGGTIEAVLEGTEGQQMLDNITIDKKGNILLVEDVGNNAHIGKTWQYKIATDEFTPIAYHDSTRFLIGGANFLTQDEEASGILDVSEILGPGKYLVDVQAHFAPAANTTEVVEGGQLLAMFNPYALGTSTAPDTIRVTTTGTSATVTLGTPATADNCSIASVTNNAPGTFPIGTTTVTWTVTDGSGNTALVDQVVIVTFAGNIPPTVTITSPANGASIPAGTVATMNVTANDPDGTITKVAFYANGVKLGEDTTSPYQTSGNAEAGIYKLTAIAYDNSGDSTISDTVTITMSGCTGSGSILGEGYNNIQGTHLVDLSSNINYPNNPDVVAQLNNFEYGPNVNDNYGARVRGYICVPETGYYTFYIASDDQSELWLSTDDNPANIRRIANVDTKVGFHQWFVYPTQKSVAIWLAKGGRYYVETIHKEGTGFDHLSVAWKLPNGTLQAPIAGSNLSPWTSGAPALTTNSSFTVAMRTATGPVNDVRELTVKALPNPSPRAFTLVTRSNSDKALTIIVTDVLGRIVERRSGVAANGTIEVGSRLHTGVYFVEVTQGDQKKKLKLVRQ